MRAIPSPSYDGSLADLCGTWHQICSTGCSEVAQILITGMPLVVVGLDSRPNGGSVVCIGVLDAVVEMKMGTS